VEIGISVPDNRGLFAANVNNRMENG